MRPKHSLDFQCQFSIDSEETTGLYHKGAYTHSGISCLNAYTTILLQPPSAYMGQVKNNEANVLQNGPKTKYPTYFSTSYFLMTTNMGKPSQQNKFPACNIFELSHYFSLDPYAFLLFSGVHNQAIVLT